MPFNRTKNVSGTSKSLDFVPGLFRILEMAPFSDFQGLISQPPVTLIGALIVLKNFPQMIATSLGLKEIFVKT